MSDLLTSVDGFFIYPMQLSKTYGTRYIYCKEDTIPSGGTNDRLFMINVGNLTEDQLKEVFSPFGEIESIDFGHLSKGGVRIAYLKYIERKSLNNALKAIKSASTSLQSPSPVESVPCLTQYYNDISNRYTTSRADLRKNAEAALTQYEEDQNSIQNETDEDGWTIVRRRTRIEDEEALSALQIREKRRREMMQKKDFYKFQGRENKRDQLRELREQFERDKERIQKMKENRKFNPVSCVC